MWEYEGTCQASKWMFSSFLCQSDKNIWKRSCFKFICICSARKWFSNMVPWFWQTLTSTWAALTFATLCACAILLPTVMKLPALSLPVDGALSNNLIENALCECYGCDYMTWLQKRRYIRLSIVYDSELGCKSLLFILLLHPRFLILGRT